MANASQLPNVTKESQRLLVGLMSREQSLVVFEVSCLVAIMVVAVVGNGSVFWVMYKTPKLRNITGTYITSLAFFDVQMATLIMPVSASFLATSRQCFAAWVCRFQGFSILVLAWSSLHIMTLMAVNRYFRVVKTHLYAKIFTKRSSVLMITVVVVTAAALVLLPIATGLARIEFWPRRASCFMTFNKGFPLFRQVCIGFYLAVYTIVPMVTIAFCYFKVHKTVALHRTAIVPTLGTVSHISIEEVRVTKTIFAVVFTFVLFWIPSILVEMLNSVYGSRALPRWSYMLHIYCGYMSCASNPVIYGIANKGFRSRLVKTLPCCVRVEDPTTQHTADGSLAMARRDDPLHAHTIHVQPL